MKWIDAPCEDPAPECGHVIERKDSAHDRSEQVLCNRLQRFLRRLHFSESYITALAAVASQVQHAAMS